jgi:ABC-type sugar transport system ATPase subunit
MALLKYLMWRGRTVDVLQGVDLDIPPGSFTIIYGPSGCGKSTLLIVLIGLEPPSGG